MKKVLVTNIILLLTLCLLYSEVTFENHYPKILTLNNDSQNEVLYIKYHNDEGQEIYLKVYDINNIEIFNEKITGSTNEFSEGNSYIYKFSPFRCWYKDKIPCGVYLFVLSNEQKILGKGVFVVVK